MFIHKCREEHNNSQIKSCLSILKKRIDDSRIIVKLDFDLFMYLIQLSQTENVLACHSYRLINSLIEKSENKEIFLNELEKVSKRIDSVFSDTVLQIWHYYVLYSHYNEQQLNFAICNLTKSNDNPIILSFLVKSGQRKNKELFDYIIEQYEDAINDDKRSKNAWKNEILFSKWWLPLLLMVEKDNQPF